METTKIYLNLGQAFMTEKAAHAQNKNYPVIEVEVSGKSVAKTQEIVSVNLLGITPVLRYRAITQYGLTVAYDVAELARASAERAYGAGTEVLGYVCFAKQGDKETVTLIKPDEL